MSKLRIEGSTVVIQDVYAVDPGKGHFNDLLAALETTFNAVEIETPLEKMQAILKRKGFQWRVHHWKDPDISPPCVSRWYRPNKLVEQ